ncbi:MAG: AAA family ATPase, partial [Planctomycetaceae bacterium]
LMAAGADEGQLVVPVGTGTELEKAEAPDLQTDLELFVEEWRTGNFTLVVIDTFQSSCPDVDHKQGNLQKKILQVLKEFAEETGITFIIVEHQRRGGTGGAVSHLTLGPGLTKSARTIWNAFQSKDGEDRLFLASKINNGDRNRSGNNWIYDTEGCIETVDGVEVEAPRIAWLEPTDMKAEEHADDDNHDRGPNRQQQAQEILRKTVTYPMTASEVWEKTELLCGKETARKAAIAIGLVPEKPPMGSEAEISKRTGIPVDELPEFDGKTNYWFPPPKLKTHVEISTETE